MGRVAFRCTTRIYSWSAFLYYISMRFIYFDEYIDVASYVDGSTPYNANSNTEKT